MASYSATVTDTRYPLGYFRWIEGKRIDVINRAILATGKAWQGLALPREIERGKYFVARYDGWEIEIHKH
jgi:hypothetical protein